MERIKHLDPFQKILFLITFVMILFFLVLYAVTTSRVGILYRDAVLVPKQENQATLYSGKLQGKEACFTVTADKTVQFRYGDQTYGPYRATEDPTAIPQDHQLAKEMTGVVVLRGEETLFRGGFYRSEKSLWLIHADGTLYSSGVIFTESDGTMKDAYGNLVDPIEPSVPFLLNLMNGPKLTHKGTWTAWFGATVLCVLNMLALLFTKEFFRLSIALRVRNVDQPEPTEWFLLQRNIAHSVFTACAFVIFLLGLQA